MATSGLIAARLHAAAQPAGAAAVAQQRTAPSAVPAADAAPQAALVERYCVGCHNQRLKTGGLVLEGLDVQHAGTHTEVWERVVRKLRNGAMPPPGAPRPDRDSC